MNAPEPTIDNDRDNDGSLQGGGGNSRALDSDVLPDEFPDDRPLAAREYGTTAAEASRREGLSGRLRREEPDVMVDDDDLGDAGADGDDDDDDDDESPELMSQLGDDGGDLVKELTTERARPDRHDDDSGQPHSPRSAEEEAIHVVDADQDLEDDDLADGDLEADDLDS